MNESQQIIAQLVQEAARLPLSIPDEKLDFLLGLIKDGPGAAKSAQRGYDFSERLGYNRSRLRKVLTVQARDPGLIARAVSGRDNSFGGPLLRLTAPIVSPNGVHADLVTVWELAVDAFRLVTA